MHVNLNSVSSRSVGRLILDGTPTASNAHFKPGHLVYPKRELFPNNRFYKHLPLLIKNTQDQFLKRKFLSSGHHSRYFPLYFQWACTVLYVHWCARHTNRNRNLLPNTKNPIHNATRRKLALPNFYPAVCKFRFRIPQQRKARLKWKMPSIHQQLN